MLSYQYVNDHDFTPAWGAWTPLANVTGVARNGNAFTLQMSSGPGPIITFLSASAFRVRFNPTPGANLANDISVAVVNRNLGPVALRLTQSGGSITLSTNAIQLVIYQNPYALAVYRGGQCIHADT